VLVVIVGPMFAGKTTELIRRVERQVIAGRPSSLSLL
jgi:thymidine kinase